MRWLVTGSDNSEPAEVGTKAWALALLSNAGFPVPAWFAVRPEAFWQSLPAAARTAVEASPTSSYAVRSVENIIPTDTLRAEVAEAVADLCPHRERVAVRASFVPGVSHSTAHQTESFLYISTDEVVEKIAAIWRSAFENDVARYRLGHGHKSPVSPPAILVMRMVVADASGVAYSADPVSGRRGIAVVGAVYGPSASLDSNSVDTDVIRLDRTGRVVERQDGQSRSSDDQAKRLSGDEAAAVASLVRRAERHFIRPQEISWALQDNRLFILGCRPISGLAHDPDRPHRDWEAADLGDLAAGVTTPLTFSLARRAVARAFRSVPRYLTTSALRRDDNGAYDLADILGFINGRIVYDRDKAKQIRELLPGELTSQLSPQANENSSMVREPRDFRQVFNFLRLGYLTRRYRRLVNSLMSLGDISIDLMRIDELLARYLSFESTLLGEWDAPMLTALYSSLLLYRLRQLSAEWLDDTSGALALDLISHLGNVAGAEPLTRILAMAEIASASEPLIELLTTGETAAIRLKMRDYPDFDLRFRDYIGLFAERCPGELQIESQDFDDNSDSLLIGIGRLAKHRRQHGERSMTEAEDRVRLAENIVRRALSGKRIRKLTFDWTLNATRKMIRAEEILRLDRTKIVGHIRQLFVEIGRRLYAEGMLENASDIVYLTVEEIFGIADQTVVTLDTKALVELRRREYESFKTSAADAARALSASRQIAAPEQSATPVAGEGPVVDDERMGVGCSPGAFRGKVRIVTDPRGGQLRPGEIAVCVQTDPGWVVALAGAGGLVVERGSVLSNTAVVAREFGVPMVANVPAATGWLCDGDTIEIDGATGLVWLRESAPVTPSST